MILSGIWHGANYTFLVWACLHILFLIFEKITKYNQIFKNFPLILVVIVFFQTTIAWVYFRAPSVRAANEVISSLFDFSDCNLNFFNFYFNNIVFLILAIIIEIIIYLKVMSNKFLFFYRKRALSIDSLLLALCIVMILFFRGEGQQFIYFQF